MKKRNIFLSFWAFVIYALVIFSVLTFLTMGILTDFLEEYEMYQPTTLSNKVLGYFEAHDADSLSSLPNPGDSLESDVLGAYLDRFVDNDTLFCYKSSSASDRLVYDYISENRKLASLTLSLTGEKSPRGFDIYEIESLVWYPLIKYTVTAPADCTVYINGKDISESKAEVTVAYRNTAYEDFDGYISSTLCYTIEYLEYITDISAESNGSAEIIISNDSSKDALEVNYTVTREMHEVMKSELDLRTRAAVKAYVYYTTLHSVPVSTVLPYIHRDAALYKNIQMFDNTWSNSKTKDEFTKFEVSDFVYYGDDRAAARASVIYRLYKYGNVSRDYDFNFNIYYIKENGEWYITSMERVVDGK